MVEARALLNRSNGADNIVWGTLSEDDDAARCRSVVGDDIFWVVPSTGDSVLANVSEGAGRFRRTSPR